MSIINNELELAWQFVNHTGRNIFLTGKAGTGKTTFLHRVKYESMKRLIVVAPTGVAAINAKGVTIHSFFQMPFGVILPEGEERQIKREFKRKFNRKKIDIIRSLDLLVIDEISMVRADLLDGIDQVLRKYKDRNKVFGGVQVLMIGDLQQLAPVVKQNEWQILQKYYKTPYFFSSKAFQQSHPINIELRHIYRQQDAVFIDLLNQIRENSLSEKAVALLNERYKPDFNPKDEEGYIILTTHNYKANKINSDKLDEIKGKTYYFDAYIEGNFSENAYPNDERLGLKKGAQVMFIKNDSSFDKRYFNGKIGKIIEIDEDNIIVRCPDDDFDIEVNREKWENITYEINEDDNSITENIKGSFSQIPLRPAWAITIHKSQGLTFEKAIIDAELSFAHGQTYVALSRCKTLEGMVLRSPVNAGSIINDERVTSFNQNISEHQPDTEILAKSKKDFFLDLVAELLDYYPFLYPINRMLDIYYNNKSSFQGNIGEVLPLIKDKGVVPMLKVKDSFIKQLIGLGRDETDLEQNSLIQERIGKAIAYFLAQTQEHLQKNYENLAYDTDNKQLEKDFEKHLSKLEELLHSKLTPLQGLDSKFDIKSYLKIRADIALAKTQKKKKKKKKDYSKLVTHIDLFEALRDLRSEFAFEEDVHHFQVFTQETLYELCEELPTTTRQLKKINGIGKVRLKRYGSAILDVIQSYCIANNIEMKEDEPEMTNIVKGETKRISLDLFKQGKNLAQIAEERELKEGTIFNHLASYIPSGEIQISDLMPMEKFEAIKEIIAKSEFENLTELRAITGEEYSYAELRLVRDMVGENY